MNNIFGGMFMRVQKDMCMLSPCGIAVKTSAGYRSYNVRTGKLRNCDNLVFNIGDGMFFVIPATKVKPGDIILNGGKPACVRKAGKDSIEVINYETSVVETVLPERHVFMGNTWFYGKIVSLFGDGSSICGKGSINKMMKFMMLSSLMGGTGTAAAAGTNTASGTAAAKGTTASGFGTANSRSIAPTGSIMDVQNAPNMNMLMPLLLLKGDGFGDLFGNLFEEDDTDEDAGAGTDPDTGTDDDTLF